MVQLVITQFLINTVFYFNKIETKNVLLDSFLCMILKNMAASTFLNTYSSKPL